MRTLVLLTALLLLAFQAQAQTLQETADQVPAQDQPGAKDQDQLGDENLNLLADEIRDLLEAEDVVNSVPGGEGVTRGTPVPDPQRPSARRLIEKFCKCQRAHCNFMRSILRALGLQSKICGQ